MWFLESVRRRPPVNIVENHSPRVKDSVTNVERSNISKPEYYRSSNTNCQRWKRTSTAFSNRIRRKRCRNCRQYFLIYRENFEEFCSIDCRSNCAYLTTVHALIRKQQQLLSKQRVASNSEKKNSSSKFEMPAQEIVAKPESTIVSSTTSTYANSSFGSFSSSANLDNEQEKSHHCFQGYFTKEKPSLRAVPIGQ